MRYYRLAGGYSQEMRPSDGRVVRLSGGAPALSLYTARDYIRVDAGIEDDVIETAVQAVQNLLEPPEGWLGRALTTAQFQLTLPDFADRILLYPMLQQVDTFEYRTEGGDFVEVDESLYRVLDDRAPAEITLERDERWPDDLDTSQPDAVRITFTSGYGDNPEDVPAAIRQWMLYQVSQFYDIRQPVIINAMAMETPFVRHMLETYRVRI